MAARKKKGDEEENRNLPVMVDAEWEAAMGAHAKDSQATLSGVGGSQYVSIRGGKFTFDGNTLSSPLKVVVLDLARENAYYDQPFNPEQPANPVCFAVGQDEKTLAPPATLATKISEKCDGCRNNEYGSSDRGRGKACRNSVRLAILPAEDTSPKALAAMEPALLRLPPTALKPFASYVRALAGTVKRPAFGVVTAIGVSPSDKTMIALHFDLVGPVTAAQGGVVMQKREAIREDLLRDMQTGNAAPVEKAAPGKAVRKKFALKK